MTLTTKPQVFIIESLTLEDELLKRQEGKILSRMLSLMEKRETEYYYIRTERELDKIIKIFGKSRYRFLHLSCHADDEGIATTLDDVTYESLGKKLAPHLKGRRIFVSACEMANSKCAKALFQDTGCNSLIGPAEKINFDDSAAFWVSFYHLMFKHDYGKMQHAKLNDYVRELAKLFGERFNYFRKADNKKGYVLVNKPHPKVGAKKT
jgi:hypothetical protein